jgi:DNA helicase-2/ATP-dependent DNA helicase PcrA
MEGAWPEVSGPRAAEWLRRARELVAEAKESATPVLQVTLPASLSVSDIAALNNDRQDFAHRLRRPLPMPPSHRAAGRGTRFHQWVESYFASTQPLIELEDLEPGRDLSDDDLATLKDAFIQGPFGNTAQPPKYLEVGVDIAFGGTRVRGRIDAVYHLRSNESGQEHQWHIVDWKTGEHDADVIQLACYRIGWAEHLGVAPEQVRASFYYVLRDPEVAVVTPDLSSYDRRALERILTEGQR